MRMLCTHACVQTCKSALPEVPLLLKFPQPEQKNGHLPTIIPFAIIDTLGHVMAGFHSFG